VVEEAAISPTCVPGTIVGSSSETLFAMSEDLETSKSSSHTFFVWSEWDCLYDSGLDEMQASIREDFGGIGMGHHREDLIKRLDHVLGQLDLGLEYFKQHSHD
jgi:hypothetical protein